MHDEQIAVDSPIPWFARVQLSFHRHKLSITTETATGLCLVFHCFTNNAPCMTSTTWNWLDTTWQQLPSSNFKAIVADVNDVCPFNIFLSFCHLCWFSGLTCGLQWYVGQHPVFVFSSVAAYVGNGSIRAVIFTRHLGCLSLEKRECNCKHDLASWIAWPHMPIFFLELSPLRWPWFGRLFAHHA